MMIHWLLLAQNSSGAGTSPAGGPPQLSPGAMLIPAMMFAVIVFMILSSRSQKKRERSERESLMASLVKNSKVLTIGGVMGTVISVKENEVVVKVDESTNTKMTFVKTAIQRVISDDEPMVSAQK